MNWQYHGFRAPLFSARRLYKRKKNTTTRNGTCAFDHAIGAGLHAPVEPKSAIFQGETETRENRVNKNFHQNIYSSFFI